MNLLKQAVKSRAIIITDIAKYTEKYADTVKVIVSSLNPGELERTMANLAKIREILTDLQQIPPGGPLLTAVADTFNKFDTLEKLCGSVIQIFDNQQYFQMALYRVSTVVANAAYSKRVAVQSLHADLSLKFVESDSELFEAVRTVASIEEITTFAAKSRMNNKFAIWAARVAIAENAGERRRQLQALVEEQKDTVLGCKRLDLKNRAGLQGTIAKYNLVPTGESRPISDEIRSSDRGVIIIDSRTMSPVEFDIRGLIDDDYVTAGDMKSTATAGLNKKTIKRFATTRILNKPTGPPAAVEVRNPDAREFDVYEIITDGMCRPLGYRGSAGPVARDRIVGLISGLTTRPSDYCAVQYQSMEDCIDPKAIGLINTYIDTKFAVFTSGEIVAKIQRAHGAYFESHDIADAKQFRETLLDNRRLMQAVISALPPAAGGVKGLQLGDLNLTAIAKADTATRKLVREIEAKYNPKLLPASVFERPKAEVRAILLQTYNTVMNSALAEMTDSGAWDDFVSPIVEYFTEHKL